MIIKDDIKTFKIDKDTNKRIEISIQHAVIDRITELQFIFKNGESVIINQISEFGVNLKGNLTLKCFFSPSLYSRLGLGCFVKEIKAKGLLVDISNCEEVLEFETSFYSLENTNMIVDFSVSGDMSIVFTDGTKE